ncbi:receptor expression-enhancing protein 2 isoform X3 [Stomoxys calcitrans]|uniref:receptor expression-enhancing protein 2 isoform X3 n=1 Tax=Stomoxys calcitrans TaxID=35570 RepID=UPI0027E24EF8|nr:receptor expression-enhancing protein 2 isoform X3 [Stomoxys calcitrans]
MYQNDFFLGSAVGPKMPRNRYVYSSDINREYPVTRTGSARKHFPGRETLVEERRFAAYGTKNVPFNNILRSGVHVYNEREIDDVVAGVSYTNFMDGEYTGESHPDDEDTLEVIDTNNVVRNLTAVGRFLEMLQGLPLPCLSLTTSCICFIIAIFISPRPCAQNIIYPVFRLSFGTLYPAYASYKAVRTKNVKEYVKWMMYWIVYAFFTCTETFTDIFLSWFPFYYEVKVVIVLWLLSPATKGSSTLYRKFVHPMLTRREQEIDEYLNQAKERGYSAVLQLGSKGVNYATNVIMQTAIKTFHGLNTNSNQELRIFPSSYSDDAIYTRSVRSTHNNSNESQDLTRSNSLHSIGTTTHIQFSEDDDRQYEDGISHGADRIDTGAARIRDFPARKTKSKDTGEENIKRQKAPESITRSRRKLREPTPEEDVDVE